jgi:hypothetical protein
VLLCCSRRCCCCCCCSSCVTSSSMPRHLWTVASTIGVVSAAQVSLKCPPLEGKASRAVHVVQCVLNAIPELIACSRQLDSPDGSKCSS